MPCMDATILQVLVIKDLEKPWKIYVGKHIGSIWLVMLSYIVDSVQGANSLSSLYPLKSIPISKPWQMVGVDILSVPTSCNGNKCLLVIQDYFTKWADAIPLSNQKAVTITNTLIHLSLPDIVHSDQGQNFESTVLKQTLHAFGIQKSHTTAYHPQGDGLVERFNRSLLQLLCVYIDKHSDWEQHLPLALYAYRTAIHSSTGVSPHFLMFGREPHSALFDSSCSFDPSSNHIIFMPNFLHFKILSKLT